MGTAGEVEGGEREVGAGRLVDDEELEEEEKGKRKKEEERRKGQDVMTVRYRIWSALTANSRFVRPLRRIY